MKIDPKQNNPISTASVSTESFGEPASRNHPSQMTAITDDEKIDAAAARILNEYRRAFEELAT